MAIRTAVEFYLSREDAEKFAKWAIGDDFREKSQQDWPNIWNSRHGDLFMIHPEGDPHEDLKEMIRLWKNETQST